MKKDFPMRNLIILVLLFLVAVVIAGCSNGLPGG
jgi:predicted small secreted protein